MPDQKVPERTARVGVEVSPRPRGHGVSVDNRTSVLPEGAVLAPEQSAAVVDGVQAALAAGPLQGMAVEDVQVRVLLVELFGHSSTLDALTAAATKAVNKALIGADPALLHPVMAVEVLTPEENLGTILGDLQSRHALIRDTRAEGGNVTIDCEVALERLLGYTTDLRSMTQGRGQFSMLFDRFDLV